ncbi:MAG: hypothetical protein JW934_17875, partial [Anaerolineae bacterium]|nr:hypothetical protein [Anaerolineae bacterium]
ATLKLQLYIYKKVYQRLNPQLIFFDNGHYGGMGHLIRLAKEMGIKTAEMQHGMTSAGYDAYNFAPILLESQAYQLHTPDYFLAYGQWWAEQIRVSAQVVIIGNPHYDTMCRRWKNGSKIKNKILLLSDGIRFAHYLEMAQKIKAALPSIFEIVVRPHPMERATALQTYGATFEGIQIDDSDNLYQRLAESYAVIGEISTALFEAVGLAEKVFSFTNPRTLFVLPDNPFEQFETVTQLVDQLLVNDGKIHLDIESIWADNWESRYRDFITHRIGIEPRGAF